MVLTVEKLSQQTGKSVFYLTERLKQSIKTHGLIIRDGQRIGDVISWQPVSVVVQICADLGIKANSRNINELLLVEKHLTEKEQRLKKIFKNL